MPASHTFICRLGTSQIVITEILFPSTVNTTRDCVVHQTSLLMGQITTTMVRGAALPTHQVHAMQPSHPCIGSGAQRTSIISTRHLSRKRLLFRHLIPRRRGHTKVWLMRCHRAKPAPIPHLYTGSGVIRTSLISSLLALKSVTLSSRATTKTRGNTKASRIAPTQPNQLYLWCLCIDSGVIRTSLISSLLALKSVTLSSRATTKTRGNTKASRITSTSSFLAIISFGYTIDR